MTIYWANDVRNVVADAWETAIGPNPIVRIFGDAVPANHTVALSGQRMLSQFDLGTDWADAASGGVKSLSGLPLASVGETDAGAGVAPTFYRVYAADGVTCKEQGAIPSDMTIDAATISDGQVVRITSWSKIAPHGI